MFEVGNKVHISNPKAKRDIWKDNEGVIIQILEAQNSFTNSKELVHIVRLNNGQESPIDAKFLTLV